MRSIRRIATTDGTLARRSRYGDTHAARRLVSRHLDRITLLASVVANAPDEAVSVARNAFRLALRAGTPFDDALVRAFGALAAERPDADEVRGRLLVLLVEVEQRPSSEAAALLGLEPLTARALLPGARAAVGVARSTRPCRGWGLVAGRRQLTTPERRAAAAHLALCRLCRDRRAVLERTRAQLLGSAGAVGAIAAVQVLPLGAPTGIGVTALGAKGAAAVVAAVGTTVLATASTVVVVEPARFQPGISRPAPVPPSAPLPSSGSTGAPTGVPPTVAPTVPAAPALPLPTAVPRSPAPAPTSWPLPLPTSLPTSQPLPLPSPLVTELPLPLPAELPLDDLLP